MAIAAAAAATAVAAAATAATQIAASQQGSPSAPGMPPIARWESIYNKGTADLLDEERRVIEDAAAQGKIIEPELYRLLGYEPIYDSEGPDLTALSAEVEKQQARFEDAKREIQSMRGVKSKGKAKRMKEIQRERKQAQQDLARAEKELGDAQTMPRRMVGIRQLESPGDPTGAKNDLFRMAFDLQNEALARALRGDEPIDATLEQEFKDRERLLHEKLRRSLGPDYATSTPGLQAIANFDREKAEAFKQYNQEAIGLYSKLTSERATDLSNLTGSRIAQLLSPSQAAQQRGLTLGQAASDRLSLTDRQQRERGLQFEGAKARYAAEAERSAARAEQIRAIGAGVSSLAGGVSAAAGGYAGRAASPETINVPNYDLTK